MYGAFPKASMEFYEALNKAGKKKGFLHPDVVKKFGYDETFYRQKDTHRLRENIKNGIDAYTKNDQNALKQLKTTIDKSNKGYELTKEHYLDNIPKDPKQRSEYLGNLDKTVNNWKRSANKSGLRNVIQERQSNIRDINRHSIEQNRNTSWL
jgi:hypothetical protein